MNFYELLILAKSGDDLANEKILAMYQPLLTKESVIDGVWAVSYTHLTGI